MKDKKEHFKEEPKDYMLQMKHDLELAKKIAKNCKEQTTESLILAGILFGRMLEREKIQHYINQSHVDILDENMKQLLKL